MQTPMEVIDAAVLGSLRDLLKPNLVDHVLARVRELREPSQIEDQHERLAGELTAIEGRIGRLTEAIVSGTLSVPELVMQLQEARALLHDWRGMLAGDATYARPVLRQPLEGRKVRFTPIVEPDRRGYRFAGDAGLGGLLEGLVACQDGWRPHRDSSAERSDGR
jgi:hypothetical protein